MIRAGRTVRGKSQLLVSQPGVTFLNPLIKQGATNKNGRTQMNRKLAVGALAAGLFLTGAGTAFATANGGSGDVEATASWHKIPTLSSGGVKFKNGYYKFEAPGAKHGAFHWKGDLQDTSAGDGHNVYVQVKVEGYDWNRFNGKQKKTVHKDQLVYDGAARYTSDAWIRACRDRGSFHPDNCSVTKHYKR
ncbi:hypothetical protein GCM10010277_53260 [Streptomyces longisporoflavus]|nr:hypothetical protein GCM10010277_53260 [Streptomyces longisporoflavus]